MPQIDGVELSYSFGTAWQPLPGRATHLAIGANGAAFHVGTTKLGAGGFELAYWTGSGWQRFSGYAEAVQVAVAPDGTPWHVNAQGLIYRWSGNRWSQIPGRARLHPIQPAATGTTLAIGADGSVFHVGTTTLPLEALMRIDLYTKLVLTIIAICLFTIACKSVVQPTGVAAEGPFAGVQFATGEVSLLMFDSKTGDVWAYSALGTGDKQAEFMGRIAAPGKPLIGGGTKP